MERRAGIIKNTGRWQRPGEQGDTGCGANHFARCSPVVWCHTSGRQSQRQHGGQSHVLGPSRCDTADRGTPYHSMETGQRHREHSKSVYLTCKLGGSDRYCPYVTLYWYSSSFDIREL